MPPRLAIIALLFAAGTLFALLAIAPHQAALAALTCGSACVAVLACAGSRLFGYTDERDMRGVRRPGVPWLWLLIAVLAGLTRAALAIPEQPTGAATLSAASDREADTLIGIVCGPVEERRAHSGALHRRFVLCVESAPYANDDIRVLVSAEVDGASAGDADVGSGSVLPGDRLRVVGRLRQPRGYRVPGALDMAALVRAAGADLTLYAHAVDPLAGAAVWSPWRYPVAVRDRLSAAIAA
ncbi:MAG: DUF4131 domain-containing protein, partial [Myxococcota bacterium]